MTAPDVHRDNARLHTIKRCRQRHGIALRLSDLTTIEERIRAGAAIVLRVREDGVKVVRVRALFERLTVVFNPTLDCMVTVLPRGCREDLGGVSLPVNRKKRSRG